MRLGGGREARTYDEAEIEALREKHQASLAEAAAGNDKGTEAKQRGPKDSGKGVRIQVWYADPRAGLVREGEICWRFFFCTGCWSDLPKTSPSRFKGGRVYDSKFGVCCHW